MIGIAPTKVSSYFVDQLIWLLFLTFAPNQLFAEGLSIIFAASFFAEVSINSAYVSGLVYH